MPHSYASNPRHRSRAIPGGFAAVQATQQRAANPYRQHTSDPLVNGVANAAAALFRAPAERANIEDRRAATAAENAHRADREKHADDHETKNDLFREKELAVRHADAQEALKARSAGKSGDPKKANAATLPAFKRQSVEDPVSGKITYSQVPWSDDEIAAARRGQAVYRGEPVASDMERGQPVGRILGDGLNPTNGQALGPQNPYAVPKPAAMTADDDLFRQQVQAANAPAPAGGGVQAMFGAPPAAPAAVDPHAPAPGLPPALAPQVQAISQAVAKLHPADQQQYGVLLANVAKAHAAGDQEGMAQASAKLQIANQRLLGGGAPAPVAAQPPPQVQSLGALTSGNGPAGLMAGGG